MQGGTWNWTGKSKTCCAVILLVYIICGFGYISREKNFRTVADQNNWAGCFLKQTFLFKYYCTVLFTKLMAENVVMPREE